MSISRRRFLEDSMLATAATLAAGSSSSLLAAEEKIQKSPNERLNVAVIGVRGRGNSHISAYAGGSQTDVTYICDVDEGVGRSRAEAVGKKQGKAPTYVQDLRRVFDDKSVDIVTIATPNHWHALAAIWAMQAGKDVYVEKPVSHNVSEGRRIVEVARKTGQICQCGTQSRSNPGMQEAIKYIHDGKLGDVKLARGLCYKPRKSIGPKDNYPVPSGVDYNLWLGPAPEAPITRKQFHYDWHWQWPYGNGDLGNQGIHQMDIARWGLNLKHIGNGVQSYGGRYGYEDAGETANTQVCVHDYGDKQLVFEVRGLPTEALRGSKIGVIFYGTEGYFVSPSYNGGTAFDQHGEEIKTWKDGSDSHHFNNFLTAVRSRDYKELNGDILEGHLSSALCHLGNISYLLGEKIPAPEAKSRLAGSSENVQTFERFSEHLANNGVAVNNSEIGFGKTLKIDPQTETFIGSDDANAMLTRNYRQGFEVPAKA